MLSKPLSHTPSSSYMSLAGHSDTRLRTEAGRIGNDCSGPGDRQHGSQQGRRPGPAMDGRRGGAEGLGTGRDAGAEQNEETEEGEWLSEPSEQPMEM